MSESAQAVIDYHQRSKHGVGRYAPGPGGLDWANQPDPFREYDGAMRLTLPLTADSLSAGYSDVRSGNLPTPRPFDLDSLAILFELSLGLSAWKAYGANRWALRCNPSSGNLHPTESYLLCPQLPRLPAGLHHYLSRDHALEHRAVVEDSRWTDAFGGHGILIGISSIHWREAWKYGMRAWRYCQHDCGHAIAALAYAAAALGWQTRLDYSVADDVIARLLGLDRDESGEPAEAEVPDALLWVGSPDARPDIARLLDVLGNARWFGRANRLSRSHVPWTDIDSIHRATHKASSADPTTTHLALLPSASGARARSPVCADRPAASQRRRFRWTHAHHRGGVVCDARLPAFSPDTPPWNALTAPVQVHPALMVHRVHGLEPGLYMFVRDAAALPELKQSDASGMDLAKNRAGSPAVVSVVAVRSARSGQDDLLSPEHRRGLVFRAGDDCPFRNGFA
jgi:SagB-type dehydrogenase family enzyme